MDNPTTQPPPVTPPSGPFNKWADCWKTLKKLPHPVSETDREAVLDRIGSSSQRMQIAFEILCFMREPKFPARLRWVEAPMLNILGVGDEEPDLEAKTVASEAKTWVFREFREVRNIVEWKRFVASGRHLWVLYALLKASTNKQILVEALTALAECAEHCQNTSPDGKPKRHAIPAADAKWIAKVLKGKIPAKFDLPKAFLETLFAINATADLSEALRRETNGLQFRLKQTGEELEAEKKAKSAADERTGALQTELGATKATLAQAQKDLKEERLHITRQGGFNEVARGETINKVMSLVRQGVIHRLENIAAYADREKPDREEILALIGEIQKHLGSIEEAISK
jgi:hypothetical protein